MAKFPKDEVLQILLEDEELVRINGKWELLYKKLIKGELGAKSQLKTSYNLGNITDYNLISEILTKWVSQNGISATTTVFIKTLRDNGFVESADNLAAKFEGPNPGASFPTESVVKILKEERQLILRWQELYNSLGINDSGTLVTLDNGSKNGTLQAYNLFQTIMSIWVDQQGRAATITKLIGCLRGMGMINIAEKLEKTF